MKITDEFIAATGLILAAVGDPGRYPTIMEFINENFEVCYDDSENADCDE